MDDPDALSVTADALLAGAVVVIPTDTVYGIAAVAQNRDAVAAIFHIKSRPVDKPIALLVADEQMASVWGDLSDAIGAVRTGWPGALTVVVPRAQAKRGVFLGGEPTTVGLRVPNHPFVLDLIARVGPLAATSANPTGRPTGETSDAIAAALPEVELIVDGGPLGAEPSRVVSFIGGRRDLR